MLCKNGYITLITGLPASGKTTLSLELEKKIKEMQKLVCILDGDLIRKGLSSDLGFSKEDRQENIRRVGEVARLFVNTGFIVIVALIAPFREDRNLIRNAVHRERFIEIFLDCPLEICERRDPKGLYKKARCGEIKEFTGISSPYEPCINPEVRLHTDHQSIEECVQHILKYFKNSGVF